MNYEGVGADLLSSRSGQRLVVCGAGTGISQKSHKSSVFFGYMQIF